jgi:hypothetical protein
MDATGAPVGRFAMLRTSGTCILYVPFLLAMVMEL